MCLWVLVKLFFIFFWILAVCCPHRRSKEKGRTWADAGQWPLQRSCVDGAWTESPWPRPSPRQPAVLRMVSSLRRFLDKG